HSALAMEVRAVGDVEGLALVGDNHERLRRADRGLAVLRLERRELAVASANEKQRGENQARGDGRRPPGSNRHSTTLLTATTLAVGTQGLSSTRSTSTRSCSTRAG